MRVEQSLWLAPDRKTVLSGDEILPDGSTQIVGEGCEITAEELRLRHPDLALDDLRQALDKQPDAKARSAPPENKALRGPGATK